MKKIFVFILLFSFSFTILCGCGPLSPAPESTVTPEASPSAIINIPPTLPPSPSPTVNPTASPNSTYLPHITLRDDYYVAPENYTDIIIDKSCMELVNIPQNLREMGFGTVSYNFPGSFRIVNQYISYPVNFIDVNVGFGQFLGEVVSYDIVHNMVVDARPLHGYYRTQDGSFIQTTYNYLKEDALFISFGTQEEYNQYVAENDKGDQEEYTTISKEVNGVLSGGIYDIEYKKGLNFALVSQSGKYAFVSQTLEYVPSIFDEGVQVLQRKDIDFQHFALVDMEAGEVVRKYKIDLNGVDLNKYTLVPSISNNDQFIIIYLYPTGGGSPLTTVAIVINIKDSLKQTSAE